MCVNQPSQSHQPSTINHQQSGTKTRDQSTKCIFTCTRLGAKFKLPRETSTPSTMVHKYIYVIHISVNVYIYGKPLVNYTCPILPCSITHPKIAVHLESTWRHHCRRRRRALSSIVTGGLARKSAMAHVDRCMN